MRRRRPIQVDVHEIGRRRAAWRGSGAGLAGACFFLLILGAAVITAALGMLVDRPPL